MSNDIGRIRVRRDQPREVIEDYLSGSSCRQDPFHKCYTREKTVVFISFSHPEFVIRISCGKRSKVLGNVCSLYRLQFDNAGES
jgi:hypothetical protein